MKARHHDKYFQDRVEKGKNRIKMQNQVLQYMFDTSPSICFQEGQESFDDMLTMRVQCKLSDYVLGTSLEQGFFTEYSPEVKDYYSCLAALEALLARDLVSRTYEYRIVAQSGNEITHTSNNIQIQRFLESFDTLAPFLYAIANDSLKSYKSRFAIGRFLNFRLTYALTKKGYDVALTLQLHKEKAEEFEEQKALAKQQHEDNQKQAIQNYEIAEKAKSASVSSARTAKIAVVAAFTIAIGSIGNLGLSVWQFLNP